MRATVRKKLFAVVLGSALAGASVPALDYLISQSIDRQGRLEAGALARRAMAMSENRIEQILATMARLTAANISSCQGTNLEAMRREVLASIPVKDIAIVSAAGATVCAYLDTGSAERRILASQFFPGIPDTMLDIVVLESGKRMLRVRKIGGGLAAMAPVELLLPDAASDGDALAAVVTLRTDKDAVIAGTGRPADGKPDDGFSADLKSEKFGLKIAVGLPHGNLANSRNVSRLIALLGVACVGLIVAGIVLFRRRKTHDPVADLERAIAAGEIVPYFQPIVNIWTGQLHGAEVLARWRKPDGTLIQPGVFIPLAESCGLIRPLTIALMKNVCAAAGPVLGRRSQMKIAFNFSAQLFSDDSIVADVREIFSKSPLKLSQLVLELTERDPIENFTETGRVVAALQGLGCRISIDDVGTGHSGLSYILKLGADIIKIDKIFVDSIGTDRNSMTIVETLLDLARNMRMDIVAEGVESFDQVVCLRELGIRLAQGFVFAPPLPGGSFLQLVEAAEPLPRAAGAQTEPAAPRIALAGRG